MFLTEFKKGVALHLSVFLRGNRYFRRFLTDFDVSFLSKIGDIKQNSCKLTLVFL